MLKIARTAVAVLATIGVVSVANVSRSHAEVVGSAVCNTAVIYKFNQRIAYIDYKFKYNPARREVEDSLAVQERNDGFARCRTAN